ncbi:MAG: CapA family protein [Deltaproteobacteria bacterium]|jgi:hypothetical protein|nr:CapA family protein [Deltaproteobacteria bacterium]
MSKPSAGGRLPGRGFPFSALFVLILAIGALAACGVSVGRAQDAPQEGGTISLAAMGDIMLGTENLLPPDGAKGFFTDVLPYLSGRDIIFGNLEGPLTDRGKPSKDTSTGRSFCFRTPPSYGQVLKDAGLNIVSLANNHAFDYGQEGKDQTEEVLDALGIAHTGGPGEIAWMEVKGRNVAFIGLAPNRGCQNINDIDGAVALVGEALEKDPKALVIVSMHGGAEGTGHLRVPDGPETFLGENRGNLKKLSHALIDKGAAMIIGHGPHVPRGAELYKGRLIAYSLGNFATGSGMNVKGATGLAPLLLAEIGPDGETLSYSFVSFRQQPNKGPKLDPTNEAAKLVEQLSKEL